MYVISACLCGINCKYNGKNNFNESCAKLFRQGKAILVCPEQLGGLCTPRTPTELKNLSSDILNGNGNAITSDGIDVTNQFIKGAYETLKIAKDIGATKAILKENSPSCGVNNVYDGTFQGKKIEGMGITAYLLEKEGIEVFSEEDLEPNRDKLIYLDEYSKSRAHKRKILKLKNESEEEFGTLNLTDNLGEFSDLPEKVQDNVKKLMISLAEDLMGFTEIDEIAEATGLSIEEVMEIKNDNK